MLYCPIPQLETPPMPNLSRLAILLRRGRVKIWRDDAHCLFDDCTDQWYWGSCCPYTGDLLGSFGGRLTEQDVQTLADRGVGYSHHNGRATHFIVHGVTFATHSPLFQPHSDGSFSLLPQTKH